MEASVGISPLQIMESYEEPAKTMRQTLLTLRARYYEMGKSLAAPEQYLRFPETPQNDGHPHIEYEGATLVYVVTDRGRRFRERRTTDPEELLYWLVSDLTWTLASDYERTHRIKTEDFRRQLFAKDAELLDSVNPEWGRLKRAEYDNILLRQPYQDPKP